MNKRKYLKHPENNRVFPWSFNLAGRGDMISCDADGNPLNEDCVMPEAERFKMPNVIHSGVDGWGLGNPEKRKVMETQLNEKIREGNEEWEKRNNTPYDGVMGILLDWVPERDKNRFYYERNLLLNNYRHEQVLELLDLWPKYNKEQLDVSQRIKIELDKKKVIEDLDIIKKVQSLDDSIFAQMHRELVQAIEYLAFLKQAVDAGEEEGVRMLGGQDAARGFKIRSSASKGGVNKGINHAQEHEDIHEAEKQVMKKRTRRKPGQRELARLIVSELYPDLPKDAAAKKAEAVRQQLRK